MKKLKNSTKTYIIQSIFYETNIYKHMSNEFQCSKYNMRSVFSRIEPIEFRRFNFVECEELNAIVVSHGRRYTPYHYAYIIFYTLYSRYTAD